MEQIILFAFLILFPFGQIIKIGIVNPIDVVVGIAAIYAVIKRFPKPKIFVYFQKFLLIAGFSWIVGSLIFAKAQVFYGLLYLIRLTAYFYFLVFAYQFKDKKLLLNSLLAVSIFSALFGWVQYLFYPDVRALIEYGWDDHLYRMVGTFLDPAFLGLILVLGLIISLTKKKNLISLFLLAGIAFTYSRASFLAAFIPLIYKKAWVFLAVFIGLIIFLPRTAGEGVKLERTASISARFENYRESFEIFRKNPLFGVGFNNICLAKDGDFSSHSCSGSESSLLFLLATTGILGFLSFTHLIFSVPLYTKNSMLITSFLAVFVHSFFANSLFYPWIMGYLMILLSISLRSKVKS